MKLLLKLFALALFCFTTKANAQNWTAHQLDTANTAKNICYLSLNEKECFIYINLARMYPKQFMQCEVLPIARQYNSNYYYTSLVTKLKTMQPSRALQFDSAMYEYAKCFAIETGINGIVGHIRTTCPKVPQPYGECCAYGYDLTKGKEVILQLLVDNDVPSLGHRKNCLNDSFNKLGAALYSHKIYGYCAVLDFTY